ncbi:hypothetical protein [Clostridium sp. Marseille-P3244]|uniref:hypothetical protein n=1 Tax=Clostridium sp. Marseille-P3244 TaxID=1871020 RepID=UPI000A7DE6DA|nr:hypothetical protein [Clostridium sp. Marseille-P3244]
MKKSKVVLVMCSVIVLLSACGPTRSDDMGKSVEKQTEENEKSSEEHKPKNVKVSPDKYTWYIKDYVGRNLASFGYTSMGGDRMDTYGEGYLKLVFVNGQGTYINIDDEEELKKYVVINQNITPDTEMKYVFEKDEGGKELDGLIEHQTYEEIVLSIKLVKESGKSEKDVLEIKASPDKYTQYIRDYTGRNLATCGYVSMAGDFRDSYGAANVKLILIPEDGSYIDISDEEVLKEYKVTQQSIEPNTEMKLEFMKNGNGDEYSNLVENQNISEIELYVTKISK